MDFSTAAFAIVGSWGAAFLGSYLKKKGENWATKEDIKLLTAQVAATTETAKRIEGSITHEYRRWEVKKEVLFAIVEKFGKLHDALSRLISAAAFPAKADRQDVVDAGNTLTGANQEFGVNALKVRIFCSTELADQVNKVGLTIGEAAKRVTEGRPGDAQKMLYEMQSEVRRLTALIRNELDPKEASTLIPNP